MSEPVQLVYLFLKDGAVLNLGAVDAIKPVKKDSCTVYLRSGQEVHYNVSAQILAKDLMNACRPAVPTPSTPVTQGPGHIGSVANGNGAHPGPQP